MLTDRSDTSHRSRSDRSEASSDRSESPRVSYNNPLRESYARGRELAKQDQLAKQQVQQQELEKQQSAKSALERRKSYGRVQRRAASPAVTKTKRPPPAPTVAGPAPLPAAPLALQRRPSTSSENGKKRGSNPQGTPNKGGTKKRGGTPLRQSVDANCAPIPLPAEEEALMQPPVSTHELSSLSAHELFADEDDFEHIEAMCEGGSRPMGPLPAPDPRELDRVDSWATDMMDEAGAVDEAGAEASMDEPMGSVEAENDANDAPGQQLFERRGFKEADSLGADAPWAATPRDIGPVSQMGGGGGGDGGGGSTPRGGGLTPRGAVIGKVVVTTAPAPVGDEVAAEAAEVAAQVWAPEESAFEPSVDVSVDECSSTHEESESMLMAEERDSSSMDDAASRDAAALNAAEEELAAEVAAIEAAAAIAAAALAPTAAATSSDAPAISTAALPASSETEPEVTARKPAVRRQERGSLFARLRLGGGESTSASSSAGESDGAHEAEQQWQPSVPDMSRAMPQQMEAMSEQLEAVTSCMRVEQQARVAAEGKLNEARAQVQGLLEHLEEVEKARSEEGATLAALRGLLSQIQGENAGLKEQNASLLSQCRSLMGGTNTERARR